MQYWKYIFILCVISILSISCASIQNAYDDLEKENPTNEQLKNINNTVEAVKYLQDVYKEHKEVNYEIKAYKRNPFFSDNKKNIFLYHCFYAIFKNGELQHTLGFSGNPKNAVFNQCWILDKIEDLESLELYLQGNNKWDVEEYVKKNNSLDLVKTIEKILIKIGKENKFEGSANMRNLTWYYQVILWTIPVPVIPMVIYHTITSNSDNCITAVEETMVWKK